MPESSVWGMNLQAAYCESCDWHYLLPSSMLLPPCPHCAGGQLAVLDSEAENPTERYQPELMLPFTVATPSLTERIEQFAGSIWFAPGDLKATALQSRLQKLYLPMWLVDTNVAAMWQAEAGFDYEAITHREQFDQNQGGWHSQQITETRVRWEARVGQLQREYHNTPAPALEEHFTIMQRLGDFEITAGQPYQPQAAAQAIIRLPNRSTTDAWPDAVPPLQITAAEECRAAARANHIREFRWSSRYANQNWTMLLLPAYATYYLDDDGRPQPVLIHGQTGQVSGPRRASMKRARTIALIIVTVAAAIFTVSLILGLVGLLFPPLLLVGGLGLIGAVIVGMLAVAPLVIVWQVNKGSKSTERRKQL
jgi:hypothetical protein